MVDYNLIQSINKLHVIIMDLKHTSKVTIKTNVY